jgi:short-subunit dehydrogenase
VVHFNAAVVRIQDLFSMTDAEVTGDLAINVAAGLHTIRAAVGLFGDRGGTILVTGGGIATVPNPNAVSLGVGKVAMRHAVQALVEPLAERGIRIATATVREKILPGSPESAGVAELMWRLATNPTAPWELDYRAAQGRSRRPRVSAPTQLRTSGLSFLLPNFRRSFRWGVQSHLNVQWSPVRRNAGSYANMPGKPPVMTNKTGS